MSALARIDSWGRTFRARQQAVALRWRDVALEAMPEATLLAHGLGRTYGDACLNDGGAVLLTRGLDRFIAFDRDTGVLRCEAGVSFDEIIRLMLPRGWFLPVTPGTKHVTVGGAIANDVHGKNHHRAGTFGRFVRSFELVRSDGRFVCTPEQNVDLFRATIGGLGLTGLVTWAELQLKKVESSLVEQEVVKFRSLDEFFALNAESDQKFEYTVAWIDGLARGPSLGRGHFISGNHAGANLTRAGKIRTKPLFVVPFDAPGWLLNPLTIRAFNTAYYHRQLRRTTRATTSFDPFFYPLDVVGNWNRIYGKPGLFQYQCAVPPASMRETIRALLVEIAKSRQASFLAVLKTFGDLPSPGMLSFPRPGATLSLDFANRGEVTNALFERLDAIVEECGGAVYPAKDARMSPARFRRFFPAWETFARQVDPRFSSSFWRRVTDGTKGILK